MVHKWQIAGKAAKFGSACFVNVPTTVYVSTFDLVPNGGAA